MVANPRQADLQAARQSRYIPSYAGGAARERQTSINQANVASGRTPAPTPRLPSSSGTTQTQPNIEAPAPSQAPQTSQAPPNWRDAAYDAAYNAQIASIQRALADFETGATTRGERYGQDFMTGLNRLGYRPAKGFQAMPNVLEQLDQPQPMARALSAGAEGAPAVAVPPVSGAFDIEGEFDPYSAAARGTRGTRDEFAGRGTLRSSDFAKTFGEFQNRLNQQLEAMETSRTRFGQDLATEVAQQRTQSQERQQAAQRDAMLRAAMAAAGGAGF
jgi:hypothetical protein